MLRDGFQRKHAVQMRWVHIFVGCLTNYDLLILMAEILSMMANLPQLFDAAEKDNDWNKPLREIDSLAKSGAIDHLSDGLAVEIIWMIVQFEQQLLNTTEATKKSALQTSINALKNLSCWQQVADFDQHFPLLDQQYLNSQGIDSQISQLSQFLAHPKSKEISPHWLFSLARYKNIEQIIQSPHHPLVHFFRHSSGYREKSAAPNNYFDCDWYRETYLQGQFLKNPLLHYLEHYHEPNIQPSRHFHSDYVRKLQQLSADIDPLAYYLKQLHMQGVSFCLNGFSPCPYFDRAYYLACNPDIKIATEDKGCEPFHHFSVNGIKEGRRGHPLLSHNMATEAMISAFPAKKRLAVLVLGMHRSGTSALTRAINLLGIDLSNHLAPPNWANPTGYWESVELEKIHNDILANLNSSWDDLLAIEQGELHTELHKQHTNLLIDYIVREFSGSENFMVKDPRMCRLVPLWRAVLDQLNVEVKVVIPFRHPLEVAKSLQKRDGFLLEKSFLLWLRHVLEAERHSRGLKRCFVNYPQLLTNPQNVINHISSQCEIKLINTADWEEQLTQFIDTKHYNQRISNADLKAANISERVLQTYQILSRWSENSGDEQYLREELDKVAQSLAQADSFYGNIFKAKNNDLQQLFSVQQQIKNQGRQLAVQINQLLEKNSSFEDILKKNGCK